MYKNNTSKILTLRAFCGISIQGIFFNGTVTRYLNSADLSVLKRKNTLFDLKK